MKKVSIIIPIYNQMHCLNTIISAAITQSWLNLDVVLVNYGGLNECKSLIAEHEKKDNRILYLSTSGGGS